MATGEQRLNSEARESLQQRRPSTAKNKQANKAVCTCPKKERNKNVLKKAETLKKGMISSVSYLDFAVTESHIFY